MLRSATRIAGLLGFLMSLIGCAAPQQSNPGPERVAELEAALRDRPPWEAAQGQYRAEVARMAGEIAALVPGLTWSLTTDTWTRCEGEYVWTDAKHAYLMVGFGGPIPDETWPRAVAIVRDGARRLGADDLNVRKDGPGDHDVSLIGPGGVTVTLGSQQASSLTARSDCRI